MSSDQVFDQFNDLSIGSNERNSCKNQKNTNHDSDID